MPAIAYLDDHEVRAGRSIPEDADANELLQRLRDLTGDDWIVRRRKFRQRPPSLWLWLRGQHPPVEVNWTIYVDVGGEWQMINLVTPDGGSTLNYWKHSREGVMNFMLGYTAALIHAKRGDRT